jgi:geranylgeranyl diphosphate synthase type II
VKNLANHTKRIEKELAGIDFPKNPSQLYEPLRYFLQIGGKRIRPILTLLASDLFGAEQNKALPQALAIETFHNFTLIHDDIMDEAPVRRGQQTVHEKWNTNTAILSGDVLLIKAYQLLGDIESNKLSSAFELFNTTAIEVCEGQQMDMDFETRLDVSIAEYIEMIRLKTSVLLGAALQMGSIVAGASKDDQQRIYNFGQNVGIAFQIQDDILDLYADPEKFGKQVGGDVIANKKTILYLTAIGSASKEQQEILKQLLEEDDLELKVNRTRELFDHLKVKEQCRSLMNDYQDKAMNALNSIEIDDEKKAPLVELAQYLLQRDI